MQSSVLSLLMPATAAANPTAGQAATAAPSSADQAFAPLLNAASKQLAAVTPGASQTAEAPLRVTHNRVVEQALQMLNRFAAQLTGRDGQAMQALMMTPEGVMMADGSKGQPAAQGAANGGLQALVAMIEHMQQAMPDMSLQLSDAVPGNHANHAAFQVLAALRMMPQAGAPAQSASGQVTGAANPEPWLALPADAVTQQTVAGLPQQAGQLSEAQLAALREGLQKLEDILQPLYAQLPLQPLTPAGLAPGETLLPIHTRPAYAASFHPAAPGAESMMLLANHASANPGTGPATETFRQLLAQMTSGDAADSANDLEAWVQRLVSQLQQAGNAAAQQAAAPAGARTTGDNPGLKAGSNGSFASLAGFIGAPAPVAWSQLTPAAPQSPVAGFDTLLKPDGQTGDISQLSSASLSNLSSQSAAWQSPGESAVHWFKSVASGAEAKNAASEQVQVTIRQAFKPGMDRVTIQLDPPDLGRVDVRIEMSADGRNQVVFSADNRDTLDLLQRDARQLERALQEAGIDAETADMEFTLNQQQEGDGEPGEQTADDGGYGEPADRPAESEAVIDPTTGQYTITLSNGVDIRV